MSVMKDLKGLKPFRFSRKKYRNPFPVLPEIIMVRIAEYVTGYRLQQSLETHRDPALGPLQLGVIPLLAVCRKWRALLAPTFYCHAFVGLEPSESIQPYSTHPAHDARALSTLGHDQSIRRLMVIISGRILSNADSMAAMEDLLRPGRFAGATEIVLNFDSIGWGDSCCLPGTEELVQRFAGLIDKTAPNTTALVLVSPNYLYMAPGSAAAALVRLVARNKTSLGIDSPALQLSIFTKRNPLIDLSNFTVSRRTMWTDILIHIIRANAPTLQTLQLGEISGEDFDKLLFANDSQAIFYPVLWKLELHVTSMPMIGRPSLAHVPFPSLIHFDNSHIHPFNDDTILRCNRANLEFLRMPLDSILFEQLVRADAFNPKTYMSLVRIEFEYEGGPSMLYNGIDGYSMVASAFDMAQIAYTVKIKMDSIQSSPIMSQLRSSNTLQNLYAPGLNLNLCQLNQLLQHYPNLSSLACTFVDKLEGIVGDTPNTRFIRLMRKDCTIKTKVHRLEMANVGHNCDVRRTGSIVVLLASLIPSLKRVVLVPAKNIYPQHLLGCVIKAKKKLVYMDLPHFKALRFEVCSLDRPGTVAQ